MSSLSLICMVTLQAISSPLFLESTEGLGWKTRCLYVLFDCLRLSS
jgi:hypothetical protein